MKKCPRCGRPFSVWRLYCGLCRELIWQTPHVIVLSLLLLAFLYGLVLFVEYLTRS